MFMPANIALKPI